MRTPKGEPAKAFAAIAKLTLFSAQCYKVILDLLYAEPNFSDVICEDVAKALSTPERTVTAFQVMGAMKRLVDAGLCEWDNTDVNGAERNFIHARAHDYEYKEGAYKAVDARLVELNAQAPKRARKPVSPAVEPATEHLRNALQTLVAFEAESTVLAPKLQSVKGRIEQALAELTKANVGK